jgi:hypothetical protein
MAWRPGKKPFLGHSKPIRQSGENQDVARFDGRLGIRIGQPPAAPNQR